MFIEFFGLVGAGKSTVARATEQLLLDAGYETHDLKTAIDRCLERSLLGRLARRYVGPARRRRLLKAIYTYAMYPLYIVRLALVNPSLVIAAIRAQLGNGLPWWHKRIIWRLFFNVVIGREFVGRRLQGNEIVLLEEGPLHRAVNLFAWQMEGIRRDQLAQYLKHLPLLDLAIMVEAPLDSSRRRTASRGLPSRLRGKDEETADRFFENAAYVVILVAAYTSASDRPFIIVDNSGAPGEFEVDLSRRLRRSFNEMANAEAYPILA
jgi:thymidylate kinase